MWLDKYFVEKQSEKRGKNNCIWTNIQNYECNHRNNQTHLICGWHTGIYSTTAQFHSLLHYFIFFFNDVCSGGIEPWCAKMIELVTKDLQFRIPPSCIEQAPQIWLFRRSKLWGFFYFIFLFYDVLLLPDVCKDKDSETGSVSELSKSHQQSRGFSFTYLKVEVVQTSPQRYIHFVGTVLDLGCRSKVHNVFLLLL